MVDHFAIRGTYETREVQVEYFVPLDQVGSAIFVLYPIVHE